MSPEKTSQITTKTFTPPHPLKTAVLFLVFNRPDTTKQVFEAIRKAKPPRLYVAADGPRADKAGETEKCEEVRRIAIAVDWDCEVQTLFREENLGCRMQVKKGQVSTLVFDPKNKALTYISHLGKLIFQFYTGYQLKCA